MTEIQRDAARCGFQITELGRWTKFKQMTLSIMRLRSNKSTLSISKRYSNKQNRMRNTSGKPLCLDISVPVCPSVMMSILTPAATSPDLAQNSSLHKNYLLHVTSLRRDSADGIATRYGLDGSRFVSRWTARSSAPVQTDPGAHPASCTRSFQRVKRPRRGVNHPPHLTPRQKKE